MPPLWLVLVAVLGTALVSWCAVQATWPLRMLIFFGAALFAAGLLSPYGMNPHVPAWQGLLFDKGSRYWFFPEIAFGWSVIWMAANAQPVAWRLLSTLLLCVVCLRIVRDFRDPILPDLHFSLAAEQFERTSKGNLVCIPLGPDPRIFHVQLKKK